MTITLQAVNELIQSLESAGELSIREQKFLKLAKAFKQLAAENVELKSFGGTLHEIKSSLVGGGHGHMAKADMQAQSAVMDVIFDAFDAIETPATDRIVAGIKADGRAEGINFAASRLAAAFNHGFVDKPMAEVGDVVRMILTAKEDLANDPVLAADGLSGEYAEKSLAEWEAELREGADK
ncbi:hypothetical protein V3F54_20065 [Klebsiella pneumoniae]|uniref:hypothetical protein n=1 Tax=Klebsiella pneumoniae TaxID=573 RepID=UPI000A3659FF|nr:hypothetical protein [Klebsiella pneumoniae]ASG58280.1 hypothetical protein CEV20_07845 [Klebsiella pneumoniae]AVT88993.1 hypothetical protein CU111_13705 [Klebsiella pneumoniae]EKU0735379.1 hypothetical protein [Klebsiella pneumoniae]EKZ9915551.1 hypothetical protein [Klebsiella pneumoniae]ELA1626748.1 hypothetical protein [Klebsiella pneumoniae]